MYMYDEFLYDELTFADCLWLSQAGLVQINSSNIACQRSVGIRYG